MDSPYIGAVVLFAGNFAPRGWALCQGQLLSIAQNTALFSILGTTYGGDGRVTFGLPDLRGRVPLGNGQGPGLQPYELGEMSGSENVTLIQTEMPAHNHLVNTNNTGGSTPTPDGAYLAKSTGTFQGDALVLGAYTNAAPDSTLAPNSVGIAGGSQPHNNMQPFLCMNYIIALEGLFPPRN
jgi:microcystin-dependent protein